MGDKEIVTISDAARMIPYSRKTLYQHISKGKVSTTSLSGGGKGIYISELIRVYGNDIVPLETVRRTTPSNLKVTGGDSELVQMLLKKIEGLEIKIDNLTNRLEYKPTEISVKKNNKVSSLMAKLKNKL